MASANPYAPPRATVDDVAADQEFQDVRIFSAKGRIGRLRYLAYGVCGYLVFLVVLAVLAGVGAATQSSGLAGVAIWLMMVPYLVFVVLLSIQRCHDMNLTGWASLGALIPLVGFVFLFVPGTRGANRFGAPPPPNARGLWLLALIPILVVVIGIVAAIALPAYSEYQKRAAAVRAPQ